ncbi:MAG: ABC transporter ATP-binding protein [Candidatus Omnitrophica bacterium]|nr:ABC transporter ATP-binding protein [Candidatus Omnitrophota bacterium]
MALIEIRGITKTHIEKSGVRTEALRGIDLTVNEGDFLSIAGPSGSGKTTLLNIIGALDSPTSGTVLFDGIDIGNTPTARLADLRLKKVGFVFQAYNLFNTLTAIENIEYIMVLQAKPPFEARKTAKALLERVGLSAHGDKQVNRLSGGEQQRVAVARALASGPKVILADEPTANLDSRTAANLIDLMRELNIEKNVTFIFSTHDKIVMDKATRLVLLKDGKILNG